MRLKSFSFVTVMIICRNKCLHGIQMAKVLISHVFSKKYMKLTKTRVKNA